MNLDQLFLGFFVLFSKHSDTGSPKWCPVSSAHTRGARSSRPADRGSHTGCSNRGKVQKVSVACNLLWIKWSFDLSLNKSSLSVLFDLYSAKGITGRNVTPFILQKVNELTKGKSLQASILLKISVTENSSGKHDKIKFFEKQKGSKNIDNLLSHRLDVCSALKGS